MAMCFQNKADEQRFNILAGIVGEQEAWRDFFEQDGVVRPPYLVIAKLEKRGEKSVEVDEFDQLYQSLPEKAAPLDIDTLDSILGQHNKSESLRAVAKLSSQLGVDVEIITPEKAMELKNSSDPGKGFFRSGKVYLVEGSFDADTMFHEFSHPLIKSLSFNNRELFETLYKEAMASEHGDAIRAVLATGGYANMTEESDQYKEEAIVTAMEFMNKEDASKANTWYGKLFYALRSMLRKIFKVDASKLSPTTSLRDLITMINQGDFFKLDYEGLSKDDTLMLKLEVDAIKDKLNTEGLAKAQDIINEFSDMIKQQVASAGKENSMYGRIAEGLTNEENEGVLQQIRKVTENLSTSSKSRKAVKSLPSNFLDAQLEEVATKLDSVITNIAKGSVVFQILRERANSVIKDQAVIEDLDTLYSLGQYAEQWNNFLNKVLDKDALFMTYYSDDNPSDFTKRMLTLQEDAERLVAELSIQKLKVVAKIMADQVTMERSPAAEDYLRNMEELKNSGQLKDYDRMHTEYYGLSPEEMMKFNKLESIGRQHMSMDQLAEYENLRYLKTQGFEVTEESIVDMIRGLSPDASALNGLIEGSANAQDKVVGGLHTLVRNQLNELHARMNASQADMLTKMKPHLEKTGWASKRHLTAAGLGNAVKQVSNIGRVVNGRVEIFEDYQFMSNFKNYEHDMLELTHAVDKAADAYKDLGTDDNYNEYLKAVSELDDFKIKYMHQEYVNEFYEARKLLQDEVGQEARKRRQQFYTELDELADVNTINFSDHESFNENRKKWMEFRWMKSIYNLDGSKKTGMDLAVAERLQQYDKETQKFYEWIPKEGEFQAAWGSFVDQWLNEEPGRSLDSNEFTAAKNKWIQRNTVVQVDEAWYEKRKQLLEERKTILEKFNAVNNDIADVSELYDKIYTLSSTTKDDQNQYDGTVLSNKVQRDIRDLHAQIEEENQKFYTRSGLTGTEYETLMELVASYNDNGGQFASDEDRTLYYDLQSQKRLGLKNPKFGLTDKQLDRLEAIDLELSELSVTTSTEYYTETFVELVSLNEEAFDILDDFMQERGYVIGDDHIPESLFNEFVYTEAGKGLTEIIDLVPEFAEWFDNNHYDKKKWVTDSLTGKGERKVVYEKTAVWSFTRPSDPLYYKAEPMHDAQGNTIGVFELNGVPRVPNISFHKRVVKDEFKTEVITRDYVDSNGKLVLANVDLFGRFLPKTVEQGAISSKYINSDYQKLFDEDRDMWELINTLKNIHLDSQKGLDNAQKLGLSFPSARRKGLERFTPHKPMSAVRRFWHSITQVFQKQTDDFNEGLLAKTEASNKLDEFDRPVFGTFALDLNDRSLDIMDLMMQYQHSAETFKLLRKNYSVAKTLQQSLATQMIPEGIRRYQDDLQFVKTTTQNKNVEQRATQVDRIIDRHYQGIGIASAAESTIGQWGARTAHYGITKILSANNRKFFFLNWISDLTNAFSGRVQFVFTATTRGRAYFNNKNWMVGERKAAATVKKMIQQTYSANTRPASVQLAQLMNAIPDKFEHDIGDAATRTLGKDLYEGKFGYAVRAVLQHQLELTAFYAMLDNKKYQFQIGGQGPFVTLDRAVELRDGKIYTVEGVPQEYSITYDKNGVPVLGEKLKQIMNHHNAFLVKSMGLAGKFSQSEFMNRYLLGKVMLMVLRFVPAMTMDRYQFKVRRGKDENLGLAMAKGLLTSNTQARYNWDSKQAEFGMYTGAFQLALRGVTGKMRGAYNNNYSRENLKGAVAVALTQGLQALLLLMASGLAFNDDDDDPLNDYQYDPNNPSFSSLKGATGVPGLPGVDPKYIAGGVESGDYVKLHALRLLLRMERETSTWNPNMLMPLSKDILLGNGPAGEGSVKDIFDIAGLLLLHTKDAVGMDVNPSKLTIGTDSGPYTWQREGDLKIWNTMGRLVGLNGSMIHPAQAIENEAAFAK